MALKEKALKRLCEKLARAGIPFCLAGSWMLTQRGLDLPWHSFDVVVDPEQFPEADRVLTRLGMRSAAEQTETHAEIHYHFDGADIQLYSGFPLSDTQYRLSPSPDTVTVLGQEVPLMSPEDWYILLLQTGHSAEAHAIEPFFQTHSFRAAMLSSCLSQYVPHDGPFPIEQ